MTNLEYYKDKIKEYCKHDTLMPSVMTVMFDLGVDYLYDLIDMCVSLEIIQKRGAYFDIMNSDTGEVLKTLQGMSKLCDFLQDEENEDVLIMLENSINEVINEYK